MAVEALERNCINQEKAVYATLIVEAMEVLYTKEKGCIVLVAGNGDFKPLLRKVIAKNWEAEIYYWRKGDVTDTDYRLDQRRSAEAIIKQELGRDGCFRHVDLVVQQSVFQHVHPLLPDCFVSDQRHVLRLVPLEA